MPGVVGAQDLPHAAPGDRTVHPVGAELPRHAHSSDRRPGHPSGSPHPSRTLTSRGHRW
ncbi:hypothetical protein HNR68_003396 [Saccharopolyspora hordei]|uniref:Uncharacterized protein n=1 Tax=Saccharopolyspora hordei TaxID=1838 RepID=A0A853ALW7_9PSEU|nr:hypothetical protein [Saccharopolyspora hordei]